MVEIKNVSARFGTHKVLEGINMEIAEKEIVALLGPSGCGKTTLMKIIAGIQSPNSGKVKGIENSISYVFQDDRLLPWRTVWDNIRLVRDKEDAQEIQRLIHLVGLKGFEKHYPGQLSGGMKKRCGIARAFYKENSILLMDEPFQGLDYFLRLDMQATLLEVWKQQKQSILFITHEIDEALAIADRILIIGGKPATIGKEYRLSEPGRKKAKQSRIPELREKIIMDLEVYRK